MTKSLPLYQLDAFAEAPFAGNPAAVVPLDDWLPDTVLHAIAAENNLSETAFFVPIPDTEQADFHLRWFTPTVEVDLCGHATLATAGTLFDHLGFEKSTVRFKSQSGTLTATRQGNRVELDFPARPGTPTRVPDGLAAALGGIEPVGFLRAMNNMAVLQSEAEVRAVKPDLAYIAALDGDGLIVTAPGEDGDVASRYFAPHAGIDEDPVTGSAHCTIVPYWAERFGGKTQLHCRQVSARGGDLFCELAGDRVRMAGTVRLYLEGRIHV
ncbi:PhzF family phenazine biosynthesis protein [Rhodospirillaceae bacterium KN72]|uniref:PhzF family phenazine biosynthesis protein n=1 Tax=Pacificispira spongiicola TaxID=2729598 RepID=A0A7Y0HFY8_9PROT|nr:PhzF family phenazine biosynthesis protein [Pacificispira spongiicola]NMM44377.1 PhzF family phenazine biosynthesis protein [Pacificispira spongiicola]